MITMESMMAMERSDLQETSKRLGKEDIPQLVEWLSLKDDNTRYQALLLLQNRSAFFDDVYPYWYAFRDKLKSDNSYQRSIGLMLIAENTKWDAENWMEGTIDEYLKLLNDEKPITIRQCIQSLGKVMPYKPGLINKIAGKLISFNKETMRKSILLDILNILFIIRNELKTNVTLTGGIALQTADTWKDFIHKQNEEIIFKNNACELYFEEDDMDTFVAKLNSIKNSEYVHPLFEHSWGQRVVRFYDLDKHIIEVGENMNMVVKRFINAGLSVEEAASRMDVPVDYVRSCLA